MSKKIIISIIGATGYTSLELIRLLSAHPQVQIKYLSSTAHSGQKISDVYPHLNNVVDTVLTDLAPEKIAEASDVVFLCLPHLSSQQIVPKIIGKTKIIDMSGDFRIQNIELFAQYYQQKHLAPELIPQFVYGLPEINRDLIKNAHNVANVGCFASAIELALLPLKNQLKQVDILALTGSSGSGKKISESTHHPIRNHNVASYKIGTHQHLPEIRQILNLDESQINFVPTSAPFVRGIYVTAFAELKNSLMTNETITALYQQFYQDSFFIRITPQVALVNVVGSNFVDISVQILNNKIIIQCALDNLIKGASGTAIQNMNLMFGLPENTCLQNFLTLYP